MNESFFVIGIGSSAGGLNALVEFFSNLSATDQAAFVVVSHLPKDHATNLDHILSKHTDMPVSLVETNTMLVPGHVYVMPGNVLMKLSENTLLVRDRRDNEIINKAIDEFLFSLAVNKRRFGIAIVLSGLGGDGAKGASAVHEAGGKVLVQDPTSTPYKSMPLAAISADHPLAIVKPALLAKTVNGILSAEIVTRRYEK